MGAIMEVAARRIVPSPLPDPRFLSRPLAPHESRSPIPWARMEPCCERAIVIPWLSTGEAWEELRFALRSIDRFFEDKQCPILIICDRTPRWLRRDLGNQRVRVIELTQEYAADRDEAMWKAWQIGLQYAKRVAWWNDDIYLLRPTGWEDLATALYERPLEGQEDALRSSINPWFYLIGEACAELRMAGCQDIKDFSTHTPYLFEIERSRAIMDRFYLPFAAPFETYYHNFHRTKCAHVGALKGRHLPSPGARFLNHGNNGPDDCTKAELFYLFQEPSSWESPSFPAELSAGFPPSAPVSAPIHIHMASFPPRAAGLEHAVSRLLPQCSKLRIYLNGYDRRPDFLPDHPDLDVVLAGPGTGNPDLGSHGKFHWLGQEDCYYLTVDDDILYPPGYASHLAARCAAYGDKVFVGLHGVMLRGLRSGEIPRGATLVQSREILSYQRAEHQDSVVHMLGTGVMACRPSAIGLARDSVIGPIHSGDDEDIGIWAQRHKVPMVRLQGLDGAVMPNNQIHVIQDLQRRPEFHLAAIAKLSSWKPWTLPRLPAAR